MILKTYGCIPNRKKPEILEEIRESAVPWDGDLKNVPKVVKWESFEECLKYLPKVPTKWWERYDWKDFFTASQEYRPCCSGFAMANAAMARTLIQTAFQYSEQNPQKFNPFMCWKLSKSGDVFGGQTISAMAKFGNQEGNYLVADIGEYDPDNRSTSRSSQAISNAVEHQISYTLYEGNDPTSAILDACSKGFTCFIGNDLEVADGTSKDSNGVEVVRLSGRRWSHAQAIVGFMIVNGVRYVFWLNSHGEIYPSSDGTPPIGGWMSEETLRKHMGGSFADLCIILYAECPYNTTLTPTLTIV